MPMIKDDKEEMMAWLEKLKESDKLIIVEGKKDEAALIKIGILEERIVRITKPAYAIAEDLAPLKREVIILTDRDTEGKKLYGELKRNLSRNGVKVDTYFREFMLKSSNLSHIEGIATYFSNL